MGWPKFDAGSRGTQLGLRSGAPCPGRARGECDPVAEEFSRCFKGSPVKRIKRGLLIEVAVVLAAELTMAVPLVQGNALQSTSGCSPGWIFHTLFTPCG